MHFKMSYATCFNLNQSKILSSGNRKNQSKILSFGKELIVWSCYAGLGDHVRSITGLGDHVRSIHNGMQ